MPASASSVDCSGGSGAVSRHIVDLPHSGDNGVSAILLTTDVNFVKGQELLAAIKQRLLNAHGHRLRAVVLYGSEARGEAGPDSDVDLLVLLDGPIDYGTDLRININALYDRVLALERPISAKPVNVTAYDAAAYPLYRHAKIEGLVA